MRSRRFGAFVLVGAVCALLLSGLLALGTPHAVGACRGSSLSLYRDPAPPERAPSTGLDVAALCDAEAERRVEAAMLYLVGSGVGLVWSTWVLTRGRDGRRLLIGSGGVLGLAVLVDLAVLASH